MYLCICRHIHVGAGDGSNELEGDYRESNPCKRKIWNINENDDDDDFWDQNPEQIERNE